MISQQEQSARLALLLAEGIGRQRYAQLMSCTDSAQSLLTASAGDWRHWGLDQESIHGLQHPAWAKAEAQLAWQAKDSSHHLLFQDDPRYPKALRNISDAPPVLWVRGQLSVLYEPQIAIVGSRHASRTGLTTAFEFARDLARDGLTITSGLAAGIDTAAHEGALSCPTGTTLAVMGTGVDLVYPSRNRALALKLLEQGAIVSEFPLGTKAQGWHFPQRNRVISGLSLGVLVVEAAEASGSLITARLALEQGREVFAIPGSIHNPLAKGCHALIKRGHAKLTETIADILFELSGQLSRFLLAQDTSQKNQQDDQHLGLSDQAKQILSHISFEQMLIDDLLTISGFSAAQASALLIELEMSGSVNLYGGARVARVGVFPVSP